ALGRGKRRGAGERGVDVLRCFARGHERRKQRVRGSEARVEIERLAQRRGRFLHAHVVDEVARAEEFGRGLARAGGDGNLTGSCIFALRGGERGRGEKDDGHDGASVGAPVQTSAAEGALDATVIPPSRTVARPASLYEWVPLLFHRRRSRLGQQAFARERW